MFADLETVASTPHPASAVPARSQKASEIERAEATAPVVSDLLLQPCPLEYPWDWMPIPLPSYLMVGDEEECEPQP